MRPGKRVSPIACQEEVTLKTLLHERGVDRMIGVAAILLALDALLLGARARFRRARLILD